MILTYKISLLSGPCTTGTWSAEFEMNADVLLCDLHTHLQKFLAFDDDHMFEFYIARTPRSRDRIVFDSEGEFGGDIFHTRMDSLFPLENKDQLYYLFDYGDHWLFKIARTRKHPFNPIANVEYPRLVKESGVKPVQYELCDYDDYDEDEDDGDCDEEEENGNNNAT